MKMKIERSFDHVKLHFLLVGFSLNQYEISFSLNLKFISKQIQYYYIPLSFI